MELSKNQTAALKAVGKACDPESERLIKQFVFSDGRDVFATNAYIALYQREVGLPKGAYFPDTGLSANEELADAGLSADDFIRSFDRLKESVTLSDERRMFILGSKHFYDKKNRKELYEFTFSLEEGRKNYFLKRLVVKAERFVGRRYMIYQNAPDEPAVFFKDDGKRIAIIMPYFADTSLVK